MDHTYHSNLYVDIFIRSYFHAWKLRPREEDGQRRLELQPRFLIIIIPDFPLLEKDDDDDDDDPLDLLPLDPLELELLLELLDEEE